MHMPSPSSSAPIKLFRHIYENQSFYRTYFKLGVDNRLALTEYTIWQASKEIFAIIEAEYAKKQ